MHPFEYVRAESWAQATEQLVAGPAGTIGQAAGVDVRDMLDEGLVAPPRVVSLLRIANGPPVQVSGSGARLSSLATLAEIAAHEELRRRWPALAEAAGRAANPNIRNAATLGGNLCQRVRCHYFRSALHPCVRKGGSVCFAQRGDNRMHALFDNLVCAAVMPSSLAVALAALGAEVETVIGGAAPKRRPVESIFVSALDDPEREVTLERGEWIVAVHLPMGAGESRYGKVAHRESQDWPIVEAAVAKTDSGLRVVLGAVAMVPWRCKATEEHLAGGPLTGDRIERAAALCTRGASALEGNGYKLGIARALVGRLLIDLAGQGAP